MRDPKSGQWYVCPEFYTIFACPECEGAVKMRCRSVFSFAYRWAGGRGGVRWVVKGRRLPEMCLLLLGGALSVGEGTGPPGVQASLQRARERDIVCVGAGVCGRMYARACGRGREPEPGVRHRSPNQSKQKQARKRCSGQHQGPPQRPAPSTHPPTHPYLRAQPPPPRPPPPPTGRYITTVYWAYTTMTTVGYGDIYGTTIAEKVWCMVTMVLGGFFLSFCFGRMASIVGRLDADKVARGEQLHELTAFMKDVELPRPLARK